MPAVPNAALGFLDRVADQNGHQTAFSAAFAFVLIASLFVLGKMVKASRTKTRRVRLDGTEVSQIHVNRGYGTIFSAL